MHFLFLNESAQYGQYSPVLVNITFYGFFNIQDAYLLVMLMETHLAVTVFVTFQQK